jgi:ABC-type molybdate transport system substrate-binding protein
VISTRAQSASVLNVCHAGSLTAAFTPIEEAFRRQNPGVRLTDTAGGSVDLARRAAAGTLHCDVYAPADHLVIDRLLKPAKLADYTIVFASGRMVLAFSASDPRAQTLQISGTFAPPASIPDVAAKWYEALTASGARISGAHPFLDPGGYRSQLIFELMQRYYRVPGLYNALLQHYQVRVADVSSPAPAIGKDYDFQIIYEHSAAAAAAKNPDYRYARLPAAIDLSSDDARLYAGTAITIPGLGTPDASSSVTIEASRVGWGLTILNASPNKEAATRFVALALGPTGTAALTANGPMPLTPARVTRGDLARVPSSLRTLVTMN